MSAPSKYTCAVGRARELKNFILESVATRRLLRGWPGFEGPRKECRSAEVESAVIKFRLGSKSKRQARVRPYEAAALTANAESKGKKGWEIEWEVLMELWNEVCA